MTDDSPTAPAELIQDFDKLYPRQVGYNRYRVLSLKGDEDHNTQYLVNIEKGTCTCKASEFNEDDQKACKHLAAALYQATDSMSADQVAVRDLSHYVREVKNALRGLNVGAVDATTTNKQTDADTADDAEDTADDDGQVTMDADPGGDDVMTQVSNWFAQAAGFAGFDPSIIDLSWAEAEGTRGIAVERQPFSGGYYDDGEWQDKDGFDEERDTAGDLLSSNDEFRWYGEPDYVYFIPEADVEALTE